jgi:hypothetical protein
LTLTANSAVNVKLASMRRLAAIALAAAALAGCGGSSDTNSGVGSPKAALGAWYAAVARGDARAACDLMTAHGRRLLEAIQAAGTGRGCTNALTGAQFERPTAIGPVGLRGDLALGVVRFQAAGSRALAVLRREDGGWLVDVPGPVPLSAAAHASGVPSVFQESLPSAGPDVLGTASRWVDARVQSGSLNRAHVTTATAVGRVALAYLAPGSDVSGRSRPNAKELQFLLLVKSKGLWHVIGLV